METIRTFIAIPLPEALLKEIDILINYFKPLAGNVRWVRPETVHLTLKFLGNLTIEEVNKVFEAMDEFFEKNRAQFSLIVKGLGAFPNFRRPQVLWLGIAGEELPSLLTLHTEIDRLLHKQGFKRENRKFSPHLTLGRIKSRDYLDMFMDQFIGYKFPCLNFMVKKVQVMKSFLRPEGALHSVQKVYHLTE
jgi:2'-5' RNA ligase